MLSDRINRLSESATIAMAQKSRELKAQGKDIISLALGEPDFNTPDFIKIKAKEAIDLNFSKYMPVPGYLDLREAIAHKLKRDNSLEYSPSQIVVGTGAKQAIANSVLALVNPGDEVILPAPFWVTYEEIVKLAGGIPVIVTTLLEDDFKIKSEQLSAAITPKTKLIIMSSPCNPTGSVYSKDELESLAKVVLSKENLFVIADEIYEHINFIGQHYSFGRCEGMDQRVITINGVSKAFAMTGWRIGYLAGPQEIADACTKMQGQFTSGASSIAQRAALAAVEADPSVTYEMCSSFLKRRNLMLAGLSQIPELKINKPEGAFYLFPDVTALFGKSYNGQTINNSDDFCLYILQEGNVALVTGDAFGAPGFVRISYATSEDDLTKAIERIKEAIKKLS